MDAVQLYNQLTQQPFQPVRVHLADGHAYEISSREMAVVGVTYLDIGIQAPNEPEGIVATVITVPLRDIRQVERLPARLPPEST